MATITSKHIVDDLIANNGWYPEDPQVYAIVEYTSASGEKVWGITWPHDPNRTRYMAHQPPYVNHPKILWCLTKELVSK